MEPVTYDLSGGSSVTVHKPFGDEFYIATVISKSRYPEVGMKAKDNGREEYIVVLSGEIRLKHNGEDKVLNEGDYVLIKDGDEYIIDGEGTAIVMVRDAEGGKTEIIPE